MTTNITRRRSRWVLAGLFVVLIAAAAILWRFTPLADLATPRQLADWLGSFRHEPWIPFAMVGLFVLGGLVVFPVMLLIAVTSVVLEPLTAFVVALTGTLASALVTYAVGACFVRGTAHNAFGPVLKEVGQALAKRGVIAIAIIRIFPVAPFTVVNVAAGSIGVSLRDYLLGTMLGMAPGLIAFTAFGQELKAVLDHPTMPRVAALIGIVAAWIGLSLLLQRAVARRT